MLSPTCTAAQRVRFPFRIRVLCQEQQGVGRFQCVSLGGPTHQPLGRDKPGNLQSGLQKPLPLCPNPGRPEQKPAHSLEPPRQAAASLGTEPSTPRVFTKRMSYRDSAFRPSPLHSPAPKKKQDSLSDKRFCCPAWCTDFYGKPDRFNSSQGIAVTSHCGPGPVLNAFCGWSPCQRPLWTNEEAEPRSSSYCS